MMVDVDKMLAGLVKPGEIERAVWSAMIWAASNNQGFEGVPEYTDRGNSFAETEARRAAARILAALNADAIAALVRAARTSIDVMQFVDGANDCSRGIDALEVALARLGVTE
jgi:hypothetical protein